MLVEPTAHARIADRDGDVIRVDGLRKAYGDTVAVDGVSFTVARGEIFGLLGPNGAGKTTTVECVQGLRSPDGGRIHILGADLAAGGDELRRRIGSQLQHSALPDRIRVWEALDLFSSLAPRGVDWRLLMEQWGLAEKRKAAYAALSGGQRQRLLVALALVSDPEVVFLDEMTTGLDPAARRAAWELILAIRERGTTVVLVTHFMDEAERLCDRVGVMDRGRILALDSPSGLIRTFAPRVRVQFTAGDGDLPWLASVPHVRTVTREGRRFQVEGDGPVLALTAAALVEHGLAPPDLRVQRASLEDVFLELTGSAMRE